MHTRITSLLTALALTFACTDAGPAQHHPNDASETSTAEPGKPEPDTQQLLDPHQLEPAPWPNELHSVVMQLDDDGIVVLDALDHDGLLVARVELDPVDGSPTVVAVNATFAAAPAITADRASLAWRSAPSTAPQPWSRSMPPSPTRGVGRSPISKTSRWSARAPAPARKPRSWRSPAGSSGSSPRSESRTSARP